MTRPTVFKLIMVTILVSSAGWSPVAAQEREWYVRDAVRDGAVEWTRESDASLGEPEPQGALTIEVTQHPGESGASDAQLRAADDLVQRSFASAREHGWYDIEKARGDGFSVLFGDRMHYANEAFVTDMPYQFRCAQNGKAVPDALKFRCVLCDTHQIVGRAILRRLAQP